MTPPHVPPSSKPTGDVGAAPQSVESSVYRTAMRRTVFGLAVLAVLAMIVGAIIAGGPGVAAALVGVGVAALAGVTTQVAMLWGHSRSTDQMAMAIAGSWLLKMILIVVALLILQGIDGFHKELFAAFAVVGVLLTLAVDFWVLRKSRVPYVSPSSKSPSS